MQAQLLFLVLFILQIARADFIDFSYGGRVNKLYVPNTYKPGGTAYPLFVMLHGCTQNPTDFAAGTEMNTYAEKYGFLVLYPLQPSSANANKCWHWFLSAHQSRGSGEAAFIAGATQAVVSKYNINPTAISVSGLSAGAAMSVIMGATYPDLYCCVGVGAGLEFKAATTQTGAFMAMSSGGPSPSTQAKLAWNSMKPNWREPLDIVVIHGSKDTTVAPINGNQTTAQAILTNNLGFGADRIPLSPTYTQQGQVPGGHRYTTYIHEDKETGIDLVRYVYVEGMGHAWSGGSTKGTYTDPKGPKASEILVKAFLDFEGLTTTSTGPAPSTGPSTTGPSTTGPSTTGPSTTGPSTTSSSTTGGTTTVTVTSVNGQDGYVSRYLVDGYSTSVCKVGDKGMFNVDSYRTILVFPTQTLPQHKKIVKAVLSISEQTYTGTISRITVDMNKGPFGGSTTLKNSDYSASASFPGVAAFDPSTTKQVELPASAFSQINFNGATGFRLQATTSASFAANLLTLGCGSSQLTVTFEDSAPSIW